MTQKKSQLNWTQILFFLGLFLFVFGMRFLPHLYNVTPVLAVALLSGFHFRNRSVAALLPLLAMLASDLILGFHPQMLFVYVPIVSVVFMGQWMKSRNQKSNWPKKESMGFAAFGAILFFLVSNFGVWATENFYSHNFAGLVTCMAAGIPFFEKSLLGDMMFTGMLFSVYALACEQFPEFRTELKHG